MQKIENVKRAITERINSRLHLFIDDEDRGGWRVQPLALAKLLVQWEPVHIISATTNDLFVDGFNIATRAETPRKKIKVAYNSLMTMLEAMEPPSQFASKKEESVEEGYVFKGYFFRAVFKYPAVSHKIKAMVTVFSIKNNDFGQLDPNRHLVVAFKKPFNRFALLSERGGVAVAYTYIPKIRYGTAFLLPVKNNQLVASKTMGLPITLKFFSQPTTQNAECVGELIALSQSQRKWQTTKPAILFGERAHQQAHFWFETQTQAIAQQLNGLIGARSLLEHCNLEAVIGTKNRQWFWKKLAEQLCSNNKKRKVS